MKESFNDTLPNLKYLEADLNYTLLYYNDGTKKIISYTLKKFEKELIKNPLFVRTHRSFIVNKNFIIAQNEKSITLHGNIIVPVARRRKVTA